MRYCCSCTGDSVATWSLGRDEYFMLYIYQLLCFKMWKRKIQTFIWNDQLMNETRMFTTKFNVGASLFCNSSAHLTDICWFLIGRRDDTISAGLELPSEMFFFQHRLFCLEFMAGNVGCLLFNNSINSCCGHNGNVKTAFASLLLESV